MKDFRTGSLNPRLKRSDFRFMHTPRRIAWWVGADSIKLVQYFPLGILHRIRVFSHRVLWKIIWRLFHEHYTHNELQKQALVEFGIPEDRIKVEHTGHTNKKIIKKEHDGFNILFYLPPCENNKYRQWMYGKKYLDSLQSGAFFGTPIWDEIDFNNVPLKDVNWIIADGTLNMLKVYQIVDCYVKINTTKYNGFNRTGEECMDNNIPVLLVDTWKYSFDKNLRDITKWINTKKDIKNTKQKKQKH